MVPASRFTYFQRSPIASELPDAHRESHRPAGAVAPVGGSAEDAAGFLAAQCLDVTLLTHRSVDEHGHVVSGLAAFPGDLEGAREDPVDLQDRVRLEPLLAPTQPRTRSRTHG
jgi:hypothetical protein